MSYSELFKTWLSSVKFKIEDDHKNVDYTQNEDNFKSKDDLKKDDSLENKENL